MQDVMIVGKNNISNKLIRYVVNDNNLGKIVSTIEEEENVEEEILFYNPNILVIDHDFNTRTGVDIVNTIKSKGFIGKIIMYTTKKSKQIVLNAYTAGVYLLLETPLYTPELLTVFSDLNNFIQLEETLHTIKHSLQTLDKRDIKPNMEIKDNHKNIIQGILYDIGIVGELGADDLIVLIQNVIYYKEVNNNSQYLLQDMYEKIAEKETDRCDREVSPNTIEQRIRRAIQKALSNIAEMGLEDFYNPTFSEYSTALFEFQQVRQEMNFIKKQTTIPGKINIRKFIEGIISKVKS